MRKLLRRILWLVKGLLLIIFLAVLVLWVRSYWQFDAVSDTRRGESDGWKTAKGLDLASQLGWLSVDWADVSWPANRVIPDYFPEGFHRTSVPARSPLRYVMEEHELGPVRWGKDWLYLYSKVNEPQLFYDSHVLRIPHWLLAIICGAWPITSLILAARRATTRRRLLLAGCCKVCGYDLRATPDRCPECGAISLSEKASLPT